MKISSSHKYSILSLLLLLVSALAFSKAGNDHLIENGKLDLSNGHFDEPLALEGTWEFWWSELIEPGGFSSAPAPSSYCLPCLWKETQDNSISSIGYATYRLNIELPKEEIPLALQIPDPYMAMRIFANGKEIYTMGTVGPNENSSAPNWGTNVVEFTSNTQSLELVVHLSNFTHYRGGLSEPILIGSPESIRTHFRSQLFQSLFLTGCLFMGGLFFLGLFLFGRHEKTILYFSLFCISYGFRIIGTDDYFLQYIFPQIPFTITYFLEYFSLFASVALFAEYTYKLYPQESSLVVCRMISGISIALFIATLFIPIYYSSMLVRPYLVVLFLLIFYALFVYIRAAIARRTGANYALLSTAVVLIAFSNIVLSYFQITEDQPFFYFVAYIAFFFLQSLVLSYRFTHSLNSAIKEAETAAVAKTEFLSTMSHEIRTPLNAVIGMSHLLDENPRPDQRDNLNTLIFSAKNLFYLINDILDYNKIDAGKLEFDESEVHVRALVNNLIHTHRPEAENKKIALDAFVDPKVPQVIFTDHTRLSQILNNLISNAVKFTKEGEVSVGVKLVAKNKEKAAIKFTVQDTGIGIPENKLSYIFEAFSQASSKTTREFGGTGLGLSICKKLLELQGVKIQVRSTVNEGSRFFFTQIFKYLDHTLAENPDPKSKTEGASEDSINLEGIRILLVEDNEMNIIVATKFLKKWKADITVTKNGDEAYQSVLRDLSAYDLVLMDLQMPVMDGYTSSMKMREIGFKGPIIALTASALLEVETKVKEAGMTDYVTKPFNPEDLYRKMTKALANFNAQKIL